MNRTQILAGLKRLNQPPTAPFNEHATRVVLHKWLSDLKLPFTMDNSGNTLVRIKRGKAARSIAFVAHLDHPAFEVKEVKGLKVYCSSNGGLPSLGIKGVTVIFPQAHGKAARGTITSFKTTTNRGRRRLDSAVITLDKNSSIPQAKHFGIFDLAPFKRKDNRLVLRVADDLAGVTAIIAGLEDVLKSNEPVDVYALFTRAEEVGFHGAIAAAIDQTLSTETIMVSVECSLAYGDIKLGKGPVVRLGDRSGPYTPSATHLMLGAANEVDSKTKSKTKSFAYQQALLNGGSCEATAFITFGYPTTGLALPLANYHNQGKKGVTHEEIDLRDLENMAKIISAASLRAAKRTDDLVLKRDALIASSAEGRKRLNLTKDNV